MSELLTAVLHPERARSAGRPGWLSALGIVLVPLLVGGLLVWALWQPDERLDRIRAAVVNQDTPVQVNGQTVPLGRQLAAALVTSGGAGGTGGAAEGAAGGTAADDEGGAANVSGSDSASNFTWEVTSADAAAAGLSDGTYATVVTIPSGFSAAATSSGTDPTGAQQATIDIATSQRSRPVDSAIARLVTDTAVKILSGQLTTTYLQNVFVGFDTLSTNLGDAADGASQLADGAGRLGDGATSLSSGAATLSSGLGELSTGASSLASGASSLASGVGKVSSGASSLSSGASSLASGAGQVAGGASALADGLGALADGVAGSAGDARASVPDAQRFAGGLDALAGEVSTGSGGRPSLAAAATATATGALDLQTGLSTALVALQGYAAGCAATPPDPVACATLQGALAAMADPGNPSSLVGSAAKMAGGAAALDAGINQGDPTAGTPSLRDGLTAAASGAHDLADGVAGSADGLDALVGHLRSSAAAADQLAAGASQSAAGASQLAGGASALATGASQSAAGASQLAGGARGVASGATQSADGATSLASGAGDLASGATDLGTGATTLADGLGTAVDQVPSYTEEQADRLAQVVADPVAASGAGTGLFGGGSVPFVLVVALWLGGLATFVVLGATAPRVVGSTRSSLRLALTSFVPGAAIGVVQGLALTAAMARALDLTPGGWAAFAALAALAGVAFAAVNQGLVAIARGFGRFLSVVVAVLGLATAVVSTVPRLLDAVAGVLPLAPARAALQGVLTGDGVGGAVLLLVVWTAVGIGLTTAAVARRRVVPAGQLARWARAA